MDKNVEQKNNRPLKEALERQPLLKYTLGVWKELGDKIDEVKDSDASKVTYARGAFKHVQSALLYLVKDCISGLDIRARKKPEGLIEFYEESNEVFLSLWRRKFIESLVDTKLFSTTNHEPYYIHHALLQEYVRTFHIKSDFKTFYDTDSKHWQHSLDQIGIEILRVETLLDIDHCWYLKKKLPWKDRTANDKKGNAILQSARQKFLLAHKMFDSNELILIGLTYHGGYSKYSEDVHTVSYDLDYSDPAPTNFDDSINVLSIFSLTIFRNLSVLLGFESLDCFKNIVTRLDHDIENDRSLIDNLTFVAEIEAGDFALVKGRLAQVLKIRTSEYNFRSFDVVFLQEPFVPGITEDSIAAPHIKLFQKREQIKKGVISKMQEIGIIFNTDSGTIDEQTWDKLMRQSAVKLYDDLRKHMCGVNLGNPSN